MYNLFLDDERFPKNVTWLELPLVQWIIIRGHSEFIQIIKRDGMPRRISFDHDLGPNAYKEVINSGFNFNYDNLKGEKTGLDCVKWLVEYCMNTNEEFPEYYVHTMNPVGKLNIESYIESYKKSKTL